MITVEHRREVDLSADQIWDELRHFDRVLRWLGESDSPLVVAWLEDLWLEPDQVNLPGTRSSERPNWQRPMAHLLDEVFEDAEVLRRLRLLNQARAS